MCFEQAKGTVNLERVKAEGDNVLQEMLAIPDLAANLIYVSKICTKGLDVLFYEGRMPSPKAIWRLHKKDQLTRDLPYIRVHRYDDHVAQPNKAP